MQKVHAKKFLKTLQKLESEHKTGFATNIEAEMVILKNETKTKIVKIQQASEQKCFRRKRQTD